MYTRFGGDGHAIELARKCLSEPEEQLEALLIYQFKDDVDAHDDELQDHLKVEFKGEWKRATAEIALEFGEATIANTYFETEYVPLNGVYSASSWQIGKKRLFVAYAHEDRELPYLLVVGTV
jgi:hypothetical protein